MKTKSELCSVALAATTLILLLILFSSTVSAATAQSASPTVTETRITTHRAADRPEIYGNTIVWQDNRSGNLDIYMYDLSTHKEKRITTDKSDQWGPDIYGNRVVWLDMRKSGSVPDDGFGGFDVYMYNLSTKKETRITKSTIPISPDIVSKVAIYGNRIVWGSGNGISVYDISTRRQTNLTFSTSEKLYDLAFSGNRIVGTKDFDGRDGDIYMYDLSTSRVTKITSGNSVMGWPDIYGDRIIWIADPNGDSKFNIYMYDLSTHKKTQITTHGLAGSSAIYGNSIVWIDGRNEKEDVYLYDILTHKEIRITTDGSTKNLPAIFGNRVVWMTDRNGDYKYDIYLGTLSYRPLAAFSVSPASGRAPLKVSFTDRSTGSPTAWKWNFGDGTSSIVKHPKHTYSAAGNYTVKLTVSNAAGANTKTSHIKVG